MIKPKKNIEEMVGYPVPLYEEEGFLKLNGNENNFGCSKKILEMFKNISYENISYYPLYGKLLDTLANFHKIDKDFIIATNGGDEAISAIYKIYLNENDKVLSVAPTFAMPKIYAKICNADFVEVPYQEKWIFPIDNFLSKITDDVKIVHLTSPNNPTGDLISKENILKILDKAKNKVVIIDEVYANYAKKTNIDLLKYYDNLFIIRSFSKDYALAGLRLGYILTDKDNISVLRKVLSPYNVNSLAMKAGICALADFENFRKIRLQVYLNKKFLQKKLEKYDFEVYPSFANFLTVNFKTYADFINNKLLENKIKIKCFKNNKMLENTFRITIPDKKNCERIVEIIKPKSLIIFDMDGVLIDVSQSYRIAVQKTFEYFSKKAISSEEIQKAKNLGGLNNDWKLTEYLLKKENITVKYDDIVKKFQELYFKNGRGLINDEKCLIKLNTLKTLSKIANLAIFTGRQTEDAIYTLRKFNIEKYFYKIITMDDLPENKQKPDIEGIEMIKKAIPYTKTFYLGDTCDDMSCAKNANIFSIGVIPPQIKDTQYKNFLINNGAKSVIKDVNEVIKVMEKNL